MKILARLFSIWIPIPKYRKKLRNILEYVFLCSPFCNIHIINTHLRAKKCGKHLRISGKAKINEQAYIGDYNGFNDLVVIGKGKFITGKHVIFGQDVLVLTQNHNYESDLIPYGRDVIKKDVIIEDFAKTADCSAFKRNRIYLKHRLFKCGAIRIIAQFIGG